MLNKEQKDFLIKIADEACEEYRDNQLYIDISNYVEKELQLTVKEVELEDKIDGVIYIDFTDIPVQLTVMDLWTTGSNTVYTKADKENHYMDLFNAYFSEDYLISIYNNKSEIQDFKTKLNTIFYEYMVTNETGNILDEGGYADHQRFDILNSMTINQFNKFINVFNYFNPYKIEIDYLNEELFTIENIDTFNKDELLTVLKEHNLIIE